MVFLSPLVSCVHSPECPVSADTSFLSTSVSRLFTAMVSLYTLSLCPHCHCPHCLFPHCHCLLCLYCLDVHTVSMSTLYIFPHSLSVQAVTVQNCHCPKLSLCPHCHCVHAVSIHLSLHPHCVSVHTDSLSKLTLCPNCHCPHCLSVDKVVLNSGTLFSNY